MVFRNQDLHAGVPTATGMSLLPGCLSREKEAVHILPCMYFYTYLYFENHEVIPMLPIPIYLHRVHFSFLPFHLFILFYSENIGLNILMYLMSLSVITNLLLLLPLSHSQSPVCMPHSSHLSSSMSA